MLHVVNEEFDDFSVDDFPTMTESQVRIRPEYHATVHDLPVDERPRERLQKYGPEALPTSDLLAVILRTGTTQENVIELAQKLLRKYGGLSGLTGTSFHEMCNEYGLGAAKASQLKAVLELSRRLSMENPQRRFQVRTADDAAHMFRADMMYLDHEEMHVLILKTV